MAAQYFHGETNDIDCAKKRGGQGQQQLLATEYDEEQALEYAAEHHWRVVVHAPKGAIGKYYYLKGKNMSRGEALAKIKDEDDGGRSGNAGKWTAIVECGAEYAERRACEEALDEHQLKFGKALSDSSDSDDEECGAEYAERRAYEKALDEHRRELATGVDSVVVMWNNPTTGRRTAVI